MNGFGNFVLKRMKYKYEIGEHSSVQQQGMITLNVERLPVHHHSADYISFPLRSLGPLWYISQ